MLIKEQVIEKVRCLPENVLAEVDDFIEFLVQRYGYSENKGEKIDKKNHVVENLLPKRVKKFMPLLREEIYAR